MGKNATLVITPILKLNNNKISLKYLTKLDVRVTMKSFIDNLPMTKVFDNVEVSDEKDIVLNFQVPPNLGSLEVEASATINNLTKGICEKMNSSKSFNLNTHEGDTSYYESYLRRINGDYYFFLLGKAGEPIANADVDRIELSPLVADKLVFMEEFATDKEGKIKLGPLKEIVSVFISGSKNEKNFNCLWHLPIENEKFYYPEDKIH